MFCVCVQYLFFSLSSCYYELETLFWVIPTSLSLPPRNKVTDWCADK